jgi:hypothetical protein
MRSSSLLTSRSQTREKISPIVADVAVAVLFDAVAVLLAVRFDDRRAF